MALVKYPAIPADVARNDVDNNWSATQSFGSGAQIHEAGTGQFGQVTVPQPAANTAHMVLTPAAASGAPASGAHLAGELHLDGATPPVLRICTVAGTPGTWAAVDLLSSATSATAQKTFTGDSTHEPVVYSPQSGNAHALWTPGAAALPLVSHQPGFVTAGVVYSVGDEYVDSLGTVWTCTTAGTGTASVFAPLAGGALKPGGTPMAGPYGNPQHPARFGYYDWTDYLFGLNSNNTFASGGLQLSKFPVPLSISWKSLTWYLKVAGTTADNTANQCCLAIISSAGAILWQSADIGSAVFGGTSGSFQSSNISAGTPNSLSTTGGQDVFVWLAALMTWSGGTSPQFANMNVSPGSQVANQGNLSAATAYAGTISASFSGSTLQPITPGSIGGAANRIWFGVNVN